MTLPPGWVDQSVPGATVAFDGNGSWAIATKVTAQPDADAAMVAVQADLATRYPGLVFEAATTGEAWLDLERRDANIATPGDPAIDPRPRYGSTSVFYDPATQNAFSLTLLWYGDINADGTEPSPDATSFIYDGFTHSFDPSRGRSVPVPPLHLGLTSRQCLASTTCAASKTQSCASRGSASDARPPAGGPSAPVSPSGAPPCRSSASSTAMDASA